MNLKTGLGIAKRQRQIGKVTSKSSGSEKLKIKLVLLLLFLLAFVNPAQAAKSCTICGQPIKGYFLSVPNPNSKARDAVCVSCALKFSWCSVCYRPSPDAVRMDDGRLLCQEDARKAVTDQQFAESILYSVKRELHGILAEMGTFKDDFQFKLVNGYELKNLWDPDYEEHAVTGLEGLTIVDKKDTNQLKYSVYVLNGLSDNHFAAVCAHEYTHVWLRENLPKGRKLDRNTEEGFCELIAYKLMAGRNDDREMYNIRANAYTRGQTRALLAAEDIFEFHRLVKWIKFGTDSNMNRYTVDGVLEAASKSSLPQWTPAAPAPAPTVLTLKGVSGSEQHRFALINGSTFEAMEKGKVRLGQTNVTIRCLEIRSNSVVVQMDGSTEKKELFLKN